MFKREWDNKIKIKHLFMELEEPTVVQIVEITKQIVATLEIIQKNTKDESLESDLYEVLENFSTIGIEDSLEDASGQFDYALNALYDVGDYNKRIWIG